MNCSNIFLECHSSIENKQFWKKSEKRTPKTAERVNTVHMYPPEDLIWTWTYQTFDDRYIGIQRSNNRSISRQIVIELNNVHVVCANKNLVKKNIVILNVNDFRSAKREHSEKMTEVQSHHVLVGFFFTHSSMLRVNTHVVSVLCCVVCVRVCYLFCFDCTFFTFSPSLPSSISPFLSLLG